MTMARLPAPPPPVDKMTASSPHSRVATCKIPSPGTTTATTVQDTNRNTPSTPSNTFTSTPSTAKSGLISPTTTTTTSPTSFRKRQNHAPPVHIAVAKRQRPTAKWKIFFDGGTIQSSTGCHTTTPFTKRNMFIDDSVRELNKLLATLGFHQVPEHILALAMATLNDGILPKHIVVDAGIFVSIAQMLAESGTLMLNYDTLRKHWAVRYRAWIADNVKVLRIASASALLQTIIEDMTGARFHADAAINAVVTATRKNSSEVPLPLFLDAVEYAVKSFVGEKPNNAMCSV